MITPLAIHFLTRVPSDAPNCLKDVQPDSSSCTANASEKLHAVVHKPLIITMRAVITLVMGSRAVIMVIDYCIEFDVVYCIGFDVVAKYKCVEG